MAIERKFLKEALKNVQVERYVHEELKKVEIGETIVKRTPMGTRITIEAVKPGLVIGRRGKNIQNLTDHIKEKFKVENPQLEVAEVPIPEFNPAIMAKQLAQTLEAKVHFRRACHDVVNKIMRRGALGVIVIVTGKISGARARSEKFKSGYIRYCGEPAAYYMKEATTYATLKPGLVGIKVKIMPPIEKTIDALILHEAKYVEPEKDAEVSPEVVDAQIAAQVAEKKAAAVEEKTEAKQTRKKVTK